MKMAQYFLIEIDEEDKNEKAARVHALEALIL